MLKIIETESVFYEVVCNHPDDSSRSYVFAVENTDEFNPWDDDFCDLYFREIRETIEKKVNPYGYWTEVVITGNWVIDGEIFRQEI